MITKHYAGEKAKWDTLRSGLVPCVVVSVEDALKPGPNVRIRVTRTQGAWAKGMEHTTYGHTVIPIASIRKRKYGTHILANFEWLPKENTDDADEADQEGRGSSNH